MRTDVLFSALVFAMVGLTVVALYRSQSGDGSRLRRHAAPVAFLLLYVAVPGLLARTGILGRYAPVSMVLFGLLAIVTARATWSSLGTRLARSLRLSALVGFQVFRVPVELLLHRLYEEGAIPVVMTYSGRNFDIVAGLSAAALGLVLLRRRVPRRALLVWNVICVGLLANIVTISVLAAPVPFRVFTQGPPNLLPSTLPFVWLPAVLVQLALFGHLLLFRRLAVPERD